MENLEILETSASTNNSVILNKKLKLIINIFKKHSEDGFNVLLELSKLSKKDINGRRKGICLNRSLITDEIFSN